MTIIDVNEAEGRAYPARRVTTNVVNGTSPVESEHYSLGYVTLEPEGGQVPWHNHEQEEIYFIIEGTGEMCVDAERQTVTGGQVIHIPSNAFHQLTNIGSTPLLMVYCYAPAGEVAHWRQELAGTLPRAGIDVPALPDGAWPQCTDAP